jgi:amino acid transporter
MAAHDTRPVTRSSRTVPRILALVIGIAFLLVGLAGFLVTGFSGWTEHDPDQTLLGFAVNPLHNVVHLLIGAAGIVLSRTDGSARLFGWLLVIGYGATFVYGLLVAGQEEGNVLNLNAADNVLHAVSVVAGLATALWPHRRDVDQHAHDGRG